MTREYDGYKIIGSLEEIFRKIERVAPTQTSILIQGESGTGKELIAKAIHHQSKRRDKNLISVNCGAIPESLLESELFGHAKGAFTGADKDQNGIFGEANGATVFLDEIGDMPTQLQVKLLRILQDGTYQRVGDPETHYTDVRIISATNKNLKQMIEGGTFRQDLFYRLNVIPIDIPPLRERRCDISELTDHFLKKYVEKDLGIENNKVGIYSTKKQTKEATEKAVIIINESVRKILTKYHWPGNIRELENAVEHAIIMAYETKNKEDKYFIEIKPEHLPTELQKKKSANQTTCPAETDLYTDIAEQIIQSDLTLHNLKLGIVNAMVNKFGGNKAKAAEKLGISKATIYRLS